MREERVNEKESGRDSERIRVCLKTDASKSETERYSTLTSSGSF